MSLPLTGKVALVTGSSRSIGAAIATRLAADGANVVINYVASASAAKDVANAINAKGAGKAIVVQADVSSIAESKHLLDETLRQFGRIDFLVLNAAIMEMSTLSNITEETYEQHYNTNVKSPLFTVQAATPHLKGGARVVFFSTSLTAASAIQPNYLLYVSTKGAIEQIARILSKDLGARGINVNTVAPGPIDTHLFRKDKTEDQIKFIAGAHPPKRLGLPEEVAGVVSFLVSDDAKWVNGQTIKVNGGFVV